MKKESFFILFIIAFSGYMQAGNMSTNKGNLYFVNNSLAGVKAEALIGNLITTDNEVKTIAIWPFAGENNFQARENLRNSITKAAVQSGRFKILERIELDRLLKEANRYKEDYSMMAEELIQQGKILGAQYCLFGHVNTASIKQTSDTDSRGNTVYQHEASVSISLRIVDVETGMVEASETIQVGEGTYTYARDNSQEGAWSEACEKICNKTEEFLKATFPQIIEIVKIESEKKGAAHEILIAAGSSQGIQKKDEIKIYDMEVIKIGDEEKVREKHIATMVVQKVESEDFSICKVTSGGGKLKTRIEKGQPILCKAYAKRTIDILKF